MARMSRTERIARDGLMKNLIQLQQDGWITSALADEVPDAWHTLEADLDVDEKKEKVTLYLDRSVARFFKAMGQGYQARINRLLATWAQMKIAGEVDVDTALKKRVGWSDPEDEDRKFENIDPELKKIMDRFLERRFGPKGG